jgi:SAM-dependent methyltransferase
MSRPSPDSHYSYSIYADRKTADAFDQSRFGGPIGQLVAAAQEQVLVDFAGGLAGISVLDVGTGTGRAALALARRGAEVMGIDPSEEMLRVARSNAERQELTVEFRPGDAHSLPFEDRSFDLVTSLRVLMHTPDWQRCLGELCRVAKRRVIFDFPPLASASALQVILRRLARLVGRRAETYHVISTAAACGILKSHGFRVVRMHRQFVLPIALHKLVGSPRFTEHVEAALAATGLRRLFGSPVTILAERCDDAASKTN